MSSEEFEQCLEAAKKTVDAFVLVGGFLWDHSEALDQCVVNRVQFRFLFPNASSQWLRDYLAAAGLSVGDYAHRIRINARRAAGLCETAEVRYHIGPVASTFVIIDRQAVGIRPVALRGQAGFEVSRSWSEVAPLVDKFDSVWESATALPGIASLCCFISHSGQDARFAQTLKHDLEARGIRCWLATQDIAKGSRWDRAIEKALQECSHVLLLATTAALESENVGDELAYAREKDKTIIPLLCEEIELPFRLHRAQAIDLRQNWSAGVQILINGLLASAGYAPDDHDAAAVE